MGCFQKIAAALFTISMLVLTCQGRRLSEIGATRITDLNSSSMQDVAVYQNPTRQPLPNGIPVYEVEILNKCGTCTVYNVHIACGDFASTQLVDPSQFRRVARNDCVVKDGGPLGPGESVTFQYSNSFSYPLRVASVACHA